MALPNDIKIKLRDHLKFGIAGLYRVSPAGGSVASGLIGYRFFQAYGALEYRMNNMAAAEEAMITGAAMAAIGYTGPDPVPGDQFTVTISGGGLSTPVATTVTAQTRDQAYTIAARVAGALNNDPTLQAAGFYASANYGQGPFAQGTSIPLPEVSIVASQPFTVAATAAQTGLAPARTLDGQRIGYQATLDGINFVFGFVPILDALKGAIASASQNLDTKRADVWFGRGDETSKRRALYEHWRGELGNFMGLQLNTGVPNDIRRANPVRYA